MRRVEAKIDKILAHYKSVSDESAALKSTQRGIRRVRVGPDDEKSRPFITGLPATLRLVTGSGGYNGDSSSVLFKMKFTVEQTIARFRVVAAF